MGLTFPESVIPKAGQKKTRRQGAQARARGQGPLGSSGHTGPWSKQGVTWDQIQSHPAHPGSATKVLRDHPEALLSCPASCYHEVSSVRARTRRQVSDEKALLSPQGMSENPFKNPFQKEF